MNTSELIIFKELTLDQQKQVTIWSPNSSKHVIVFPKKIFWFVHKNIPIVNENKEILSFHNFMDAFNAIRNLKGKN